MKFRQALFWDTNPDNIDTTKNALYIIERVLDMGRDEEIRWVWNFYDKSLIQQVVSNPRRLMPQTRALWTLLLQKI